MLDEDMDIITIIRDRLKEYTELLENSQSLIVKAMYNIPEEDIKPYHRYLDKLAEHGIGSKEQRPIINENNLKRTTGN